MTIKVVSVGCRDDNCPQVVVDDETGQVYVQGATVSCWPSRSLGQGEGVVAMSVDDFEELLAQYMRSDS